ncbi:MAG TPA: GDSL-type esterase/lipase family protein [Burkholderiales bacterium]|nr:GDSL-type esterase/lipase family protein [Burkholderiales bacterium]
MNRDRLKSLAVFAVIAALSFAAGYLAKDRASQPSAEPQPSAYWLEKKSFFDTFGAYASIVMVGDSLTDGAEWREMFPGVAIVNRGVDSDTTAGVLRRMESIVSARARKAFVMIGINDFREGREVDAVFQDYRGIVSRLEESGMKVFVQSTLLCNEAKAEWISCAAIHGKIRDLNGRLAGLASPNVVFVDINAGLSGAGGLKPELTYDGVHLNGEGYRIWRDEISKFVLAD